MSLVSSARWGEEKGTSQAFWGEQPALCFVLFWFFPFGITDKRDALCTTLVLIHFGFVPTFLVF